MGGPLVCGYVVSGQNGERTFGRINTSPGIQMSAILHQRRGILLTSEDLCMFCNYAMWGSGGLCWTVCRPELGQPLIVLASLTIVRGCQRRPSLPFACPPSTS